VGELVMAGAKCYTYDFGFLHAKGVIADEEVFSYGTANMDIRSFRLNFEVNAIVYDAQMARRMADIFRADVKNSTMITKEMYTSRPLWLRFLEQTSRLLSPLL
jgi:cardiolipin synthase